MPNTVEIVGLKEVRAALDRAGPAFKRNVDDAEARVAKLLAQRISISARSAGGVAGHNAGSIRASFDGGAGVITMRSPTLFGAEFGSKQGKNKKQFKTYRGEGFRGWDGGDGYFIHASIRITADDAMKIFLAALELTLAL